MRDASCNRSVGLCRQVRSARSVPKSCGQIRRRSATSDDSTEKRTRYVRSRDRQIYSTQNKNTKTDPNRRANIKKRLVSYLERAEILKTQIKNRNNNATLSPSVVSVATSSAARKTTSRNYFLPDSAFRRDVARAKQRREKIEQNCRATNQTFVDSEFRPNVRALIGKFGGRGLKSARKLATKVTQWLRPSQMRSSTTGYVPKESEWSVFRGDPKASDVSQGELGDCWFLSSLAVLSGYPELVKRLLVTTKRSECGVYCVRLCVGGQWKLFFIDDYFPCDSHGFPVFLQPQRQTLWPLLIEKAFAKMHDAFAAIDGGRTEEALAVLTGLPCKTVEDIYKPESITSAKLFQVLLGWHKLGFICMCLLSYYA